MVFVPLTYDISRNSWGMLIFKTQLIPFTKHVMYLLCLSVPPILAVDRQWKKIQIFWLLKQVVHINYWALSG